MDKKRIWGLARKVRNKCVRTVKGSLNYSRDSKEIQTYFGDTDPEHIWAFSAGHSSKDFRGNPKYLFVYINRYRPDIKCYWMCRDEKTNEAVRALGYHAYSDADPAVQSLLNRTGVLVSEQVKGTIPAGMENARYLNLWHGIGMKTIERHVFQGEIAPGIAAKYVRNNAYYRSHELMTISSPEYEEQFCYDMGLDPEQVIRAGYPRCLYQRYFEPVASFEHDLRKVKGLPADTRLVVYTPTFRAQLEGTFAAALPDLEKLYRFCEEHKLLFIFKVHPNMEKEVAFVSAAKAYADRPYFWFWDNRDDFYEIMHQMDLAIVDYSSILSDMVEMGIPHYIRYIFDYEDYMANGNVEDTYDQVTTGIKVRSLDELLEAMATFEQRDESAEIKRLHDRLWPYSQGKDDFEQIIQATLDYEIPQKKGKTLYSFDIFDTVFSRNVLAPEGIFYYVREKMDEDGSYPKALVWDYPSIRHTAEFNMREYYRKTKDTRGSEKVEISFDEIFERMAQVYELTTQQLQQLKDWELEAELQNVYPLTDRIEQIRRLQADPSCEVILISDMYLPKDFIRQMLAKADPVLATLPLFLSNEYGVLKSSSALFMEVYKSFEPYYDFEKWIHTGDNVNADGKMPRKLSIRTRQAEVPELKPLQKDLIRSMGSYDAHLVAAMQARMCREFGGGRDEFVISYAALCFVPYVDWVLRDALRRGYETLYFVTRDGHHLKRIADAIIEVKGLPLRTKLLYASRKTWKIPSFIREIDPPFWESYGNFSGVTSKGKLLQAMALTEKEFKEFFPTIDPGSIRYKDQKAMEGVKAVFKSNPAYEEHILELARRERELCGGYLLQEMDPKERFAVVEYWGRGYNQTCMTRLWQFMCGDEEADMPYYYSRSILPTQGHNIRHNFTTNDTPQTFIEAIFANMPYKSITRYERDESGRIVPVLDSADCDRELFDAMERILPEFARRYARLELLTPEDTDHRLHEFMLQYFRENSQKELFVREIGPLKDSVTMYGKKREFAPPLSLMDVIHYQRGWGLRSILITTDINMSLVRSSRWLRGWMERMLQLAPGERIENQTRLSLGQQRSNEIYRKKYQKLVRSAGEGARLYEEACRSVKVEDRVTFLTGGQSLGSLGLEELSGRLSREAGAKVEVLAVTGDALTRDQISRMASSRVLILTRLLPALSMIRFREETTVILAPSSPVELKDQGRQARYPERWKQRYMQLAAGIDLDYVMTPGEGLTERLLRSFGRSGQALQALPGSCALEQFKAREMDHRQKEACRQKLQSLWPETAGKTVILYMPTLRRREGARGWLELLDPELLRSRLGEGYALVTQLDAKEYRRRKRGMKNRLQVPGFARVLTDQMPPEELMAACDVIVGDYRDAFYQAPLLHKPLFAVTGDMERYLGETGAGMDFFTSHLQEFSFCPVIRSTGELADALKRLDTYDYAGQEQFCRHMLGAVDGQSSERLYELIRPGMSR
ncbi:MAG: CDP-glycerol glycerophosphotransferase family protein [Lachnospiraceae bacterium]|nr:CDP-glycerol glycerophosphotransferase family protein [Lachnospiraceae bacterium]